MTKIAAAVPPTEKEPAPPPASPAANLIPPLQPAIEETRKADELFGTCKCVSMSPNYCNGAKSGNNSRSPFYQGLPSLSLSRKNLLPSKGSSEVSDAHQNQDLQAAATLGGGRLEL